VKDHDLLQGDLQEDIKRLFQLEEAAEKLKATLRPLVHQVAQVLMRFRRDFALARGVSLHSADAEWRTELWPWPGSDSRHGDIAISGAPDELTVSLVWNDNFLSFPAKYLWSRWDSEEQSRLMSVLDKIRQRKAREEAEKAEREREEYLRLKARYEGL